MARERSLYHVAAGKSGRFWERGRDSGANVVGFVKRAETDGWGVLTRSRTTRRDRGEPCAVFGLAGKRAEPTYENKARKLYVVIVRLKYSENRMRPPNYAECNFGFARSMKTRRNRLWPLAPHVQQERTER